MASDLLKTLKKIEDGRLECIRVANNIGFNLPATASLHDIAGCLVEKSIEPYAPTPDLDVIRASRGKWERPVEMYDLEPIFEAAESFIGEDGNEYFPIFAKSYRTNFASIQLSKSYCSPDSISAVKTSDGVTYENAQLATTITHTWDSTKTDKYYIIVYATEPTYNGTTKIRCNATLNYDQEMELYLGKGVYSYWSINTSYSKLTSLVVAKDATLSLSSTFLDCSSSMQHIKILTPNVSMYANSSSTYFLRDMDNLKHFEAPEITSLGGGYFSCLAGLDNAISNGRLIYFNAPKMKSCTNYYFTSIPGDTAIVDFPELTSWASGKSGTHTFYAPIVNIPKFIGNTAQAMTLNNTVIFNYAPNMIVSTLTISGVPPVFKLQNPMQVKDKVTINSYLYSLDATIFNCDITKIDASRVENIKLPAPATSFSLVKFTMANRASIIDLFERLAITDKNYTITLSEGQKDALGEDGLSIATNKGWIVN